MSGFVKNHLPIVLVNHITGNQDLSAALTTGFLEVDENLKTSRIDCEFSGSTCTVAYLKVGGGGGRGERGGLMRCVG